MSRHGLQNIMELRQVYKDKIEALKKESLIKFPSTSSSFNSNSNSMSPNSSFTSLPQPSLKPISKPPIKTLSAFLDLDKVRTLPLKELEIIWRLRNAQNPQSLCAMIPIPLYRTLEATAKKYPSFILPLPREDQGAEIHFLQWIFSTEKLVMLLFTHLAEYKLRREFSQPHTIITLHLELAEEKSIVLLRGEVTQEKGVSVDDARWLLLCLQKFYGGQGKPSDCTKRERLIEMFAKGDLNFRVEELLEEAEKIV